MITREADYAVRCILVLSEDPGTHRNVKDIAEPMHIPASFLAKILQRLMRAGIVASVRGAGGGFRLTRDPSEISLLDVVEAIDGKVVLNRCALDSHNCELSGSCVVHPIWVRVGADLREILRNYSFRQLGDAYRSKSKSKASPRHAGKNIVILPRRRTQA